MTVNPHNLESKNCEGTNTENYVVFQGCTGSNGIPVTSTN